MAFTSGRSGVAQQVARLAVQRLARHGAARVPAADLTDDPVTVALRYFADAYPDDWVLADGADRHLDGDTDGDREIQAILAALAPGGAPLRQAIALITSAGAEDVRAERESTRPLRIRFSVGLGRRARAHDDPPLNPKKHHSVAGTIFRSDYTRISVHHIGPGYGVQ